MNGHINMSSNFEITVFSKTRGILTKKISLSDDGNVIADGSACRMSNGWAERTAIADLHALAEVIEDLKPSQAIALGTLRPDLPDEIPIVSKEKLNGGDAIPRTQENIIYRENQPALVLLDFDRKAMPTEVRERLREFWETLVAIVPGLEKPRTWSASRRARVCITPTQANGSKVRVACTATSWCRMAATSNASCKTFTIAHGSKVTAG